MPDYYVPWSEREGLSEVRTQIQDSGMDDRLRLELWNAVDRLLERAVNAAGLLRGLWEKILLIPRDEYRGQATCQSALKSTILSSDWRRACDAIVFIAERLPFHTGDPDAFIKATNAAFDRGKFAWHFSGRKLVRRMGEAEINAVEAALQDSQPFPEVRKQLEAALDEFSGRDNPNYGSAANQAMCAVETLCRKILGKPDITLGAALKEIRTSGQPEVHPALLSMFDKLWGYASNRGYLRHGAKPDDLTDVTLEEAQLVLVTSSAIVSFLIARADHERMLE